MPTPPLPFQSLHFVLLPLLSDDECDPEASELDLGTKIKMPKDTMLEELSLNKNRGSKMFKMRQQRVEKFIVTAQNKVRVSVCLCKACVYTCVLITLYLPLFVLQQNLEKLLMFPPPVAPKPEKAKDEGGATGICIPFL